MASKPLPWQKEVRKDWGYHSEPFGEKLWVWVWDNRYEKKTFDNERYGTKNYCFEMAMGGAGLKRKSELMDIKVNPQEIKKDKNNCWGTTE